MTISISDPPRPTPRPVAAWILGVLSAVHAAGAFIFVAGGRTPANELEGFVMGMTASVLLVGAILSYSLVRLRAELRDSLPHR
jgi:hypothetical protein